MNCPSCQVTLLMGERLSVAIDYCPQCRGVWLAPGQLERLLQTQAPTAPAAAYAPSAHGRGHDDEHRRDSRHGGHHGGKHGWLRKLLD
ncbi:zf-TFIIB domain-containing protein [Chromobacterium sp. S0633]|uniref:TFIIB-type zinc ribbon-containing protein n=1 Tax=Chromobacterium sp. S0633 TaxID=2957805 RepID=UPI0020A221E7|nr:zf-TFIIB domain-containing protein [Chromobacterium sp. S0633]MCP1292021.1 zf-TFIIB domain-containing protein [Chromobacterium sp. S0633]